LVFRLVDSKPLAAMDTSMWIPRASLPQHGGAAPVPVTTSSGSRMPSYQQGSRSTAKLPIGAAPAAHLLGAAAAMGGLLAAGRHSRHATRRRQNQPLWSAPGVQRRAVSAEVLKERLSSLFELCAPSLMENARIDDSREGDGLGLYAKRNFESGEVICRWDVENPDVVMFPLDGLAETLDTEDYGAMAFQLLRAERESEQSAWKAWLAAGVEAPETHWLRLILSDPLKVKDIWSSTTRGEDISSMALSLRDDLQQLGEDVSLPEWTRVLSIAMSRSVLFDYDERPVLVLGLDMLQDGADTNVVARLDYGTSGGLLGLGLGGNTYEKMKEVQLVADRDILEGEELLTKYLRQPHPGGYLERYGFIPARFLEELSEGAVSLAFEPVGKDDDWFDEKVRVLEDLGKTNRPMDFLVSTNDVLIAPVPGMRYEDMSTVERMVHALRFNNLADKDAFLLDAVFLANIWENMCDRISPENESRVCEDVVAECDRWINKLETFDEELDESEEEQDRFAKMLAKLRRSEVDVLERIKVIFSQELQDTASDLSRQYWVDRQMKKVFPNMNFQA